jgi:DNA-binding transcriptional regulator YiaG
MNRRGNHALQKDNLPEAFYELSLNLVELDPAYPREPHTLGEHIRKARMDRRLMIKELAALVGVSPDTIINWELRDVRPKGKSLEDVREVLGLSERTSRISSALIDVTIPSECVTSN